MLCTITLGHQLVTLRVRLAGFYVCVRVQVRGPQQVLTAELREKPRISDIERRSTFSRIMFSLISSISVYMTRAPLRIPWDAQGNGKR